MNYFKDSIKDIDGRELNLYDVNGPKDLCYIPWERFVLKQNDGLAPCCYHEADEEASKKFGKNKLEDFETLFQSEKFKEFRKEISTKEYKYCSRCPIYENKDSRFLNEFLMVDMFDLYGKHIVNQYKFGWDFEEKYPHTLELSFDLSCNIKCKTCRNDLIPDYKIPDGLLSKIIEYAKHCTNINIGGDGEVFFSKYYLEFLSHDLSNTNIKSITLITNGTLFNKTNWEKIHPNTRKLIRIVRLSIDACTKDTYEFVRNGSKWNILLNNLKFISELKKEYKFKFHTNYTISKWNYKEIINFPEFAKRYNFDLILFNYAQQNFRLNQTINERFVIDENTKNECKEIISMLKENKDICII